MKQIFLLLAVSLLSQTALAQQPSKKEMQEQMQVAIKELNAQIKDLEKQLAEARANKEDEETIKNLEEQIALLKKQVEMMGGLTTKMPDLPEKQLKQAQTNVDNPGIPKRDAARIRQMPDKILTDAELVAFLKKINAEVEKRLNPENRAEAQKIYAALKAEKRSPDYIGNVASALWMANQPEEALYILGKDCSATMNTNNLNNYAAFLTMTGGEHAAIPILRNLEKKFPTNSTIQNNIGQAWFGLGDMNNAERHLDNAMRAYGIHSQANQTKCLIQKSRGDKKGACESMKRSIRENYTAEKESKLEELGEKLEYNDIPFRYPIKAELLGVTKFIQSVPDYPMEGGATAASSSMEWWHFKQKIAAMMEEIQKKREVLKVQVEAHYKRAVANPNLLKAYNNPVHNTARRKMQLLGIWVIEMQQSFARQHAGIADSIAKWKADYAKAMERLTACGGRKNAATTLLQQANSLLKQLNEKSLRLTKLVAEAEANLSMYAATHPAEYQLYIESLKHGVLSSLNSLQCEFEVGCIQVEVPDPGLRKPIPDFDSANCQFREEFRIPPFPKLATIKIECNKMSTEFEIDTELGIKIKLGWEEDLRALGQQGVEWHHISKSFTKGTVEVGKEWGPDEVTKFGPKGVEVIGAELKGEIGVGIEITAEGIKEVYIKGSTSVDLAGAIDGEFLTPLGPSDPKGLSAVGGEVKLSWNVGQDGGWATNQVSSSGKIMNGIDIQIAGPK